MVIGFDAKRAFLNNSGLGNYSRTLITSLVSYFPDNNYVLYTPKTRQIPFDGFISEKNNCTIQQPESNAAKLFAGAWRSFSLPSLFSNNGLQLYHGLSNELPLAASAKKIPWVVTLHDLIFIRYPELYPYIDRQVYKFKFKSACKNADLIFATSEQTRNDIISFFNIAESKIKVVYQSCDPLFQQQLPNEVLVATKQQYHLPDNYLLYVGTIEARKNLLTIVKALTTVKDIPLVVVGKKKSYYDTVRQYIQQHNLQNRVLFLENVTVKQLTAIYQQARLFIYPSVFEGFGIPILEALWSKVPVITSLGSCFREVGGPYSSYIDPIDDIALADKINFLISNQTVREQMRIKGFEYVQQFHPRAVTQHVMQLYQSLF